MADTLAAATAKGCITIIGGGDSVAAVEQVCCEISGVFRLSRLFSIYVQFVYELPSMCVQHRMLRPARCFRPTLWRPGFGGRRSVRLTRSQAVFFHASLAHKVPRAVDERVLLPLRC